MRLLTNGYVTDSPGSASPAPIPRAASSVATKLTRVMESRLRSALCALSFRYEAVLPHVRQSFSWDCGIACSEAILRARGVSVTVEELRLLCKTESVWSIDVAYLLRCHFNVSLTYYTIAVGVRPEFEQEEFYRKHLHADTVRVTALFEDAKRNDVRVVQRSLKISEILAAVQNGDLVIILLDKRIISCLLCDESTSALSPSTAKTGFIGHYCILYAYSDSLHGGVFLFKGTLLYSDVYP
jgi:Guanylylate cyclase